MRYKLVYSEMCVRDGDINQKPTTREFNEEDDVSAVNDANEFLKKEYVGLSVDPWAPQLFNGKRLVASSNPEYPPHAHYLVWTYPIGATRQLVSV